MARKVKDKELDTREARGKLKARGKPYYRAIERGLHLGYRRLKGSAGTWVARHYVGAQAYQTESLGLADDLSDADGIAVLDFWQAQNKARERMVSRAHAAAGKHGPLTVADALENHLHFLTENRKSGRDDRIRAEALILPKLGHEEVEKLTPDKLRRWLVALAKSPARLRTAKGEKQNFRAHREDDDEAVRRRRSSANRTFSILKAALNRAWRDGKVPSDSAWRRVEAFESVEAARVRYLTVAEAERLINASDEDFRDLVIAALQTGARYGELVRLRVEDFKSDAGMIAIRQSKSGKPRHVALTDEGVAFFTQLCAGRAGNEVMLRKVNGAPWKESHQLRPIAVACACARIVPSISFHGLRHTYATLAIMNGAPLMVIGRNLGHASTKMVEKHYGHLAPSYIVDAIRAAVPKFGVKAQRNVTPLRQ
jgi:integrase